MVNRYLYLAFSIISCPYSYNIYDNLFLINSLSSIFSFIPPSCTEIGIDISVDRGVEIDVDRGLEVDNRGLKVELVEIGDDRGLDVDDWGVEEELVEIGVDRGLVVDDRGVEVDDWGVDVDDWGVDVELVEGLVVWKWQGIEVV